MNRIFLFYFVSSNYLEVTIATHFNRDTHLTTSQSRFLDKTIPYPHRSYKVYLSAKGDQ